VVGVGGGELGGGPFLSLMLILPFHIVMLGFCSRKRNSCAHAASKLHRGELYRRLTHYSPISFLKQIPSIVQTRVRPVPIFNTSNYGGFVASLSRCAVRSQ